MIVRFLFAPVTVELRDARIKAESVRPPIDVSGDEALYTSASS